MQDFLLGLGIGIGTILVILLIVFMIKVVRKNNFKTLIRKWQFWVCAFVGLAVIGAVIPKEPTQEIIGSVLYLYRDGSHSNRSWYQIEACEEFEKIKGDIPKGITSVCVWYKADLTDAKGNTSKETVYRIGLSPSDIEDINWSKFLPEDIEQFQDGGFYAWVGLK